MMRNGSARQASASIKLGLGRAWQILSLVALVVHFPGSGLKIPKLAKSKIKGDSRIWFDL